MARKRKLHGNIRGHGHDYVDKQLNLSLNNFAFSAWERILKSEALKGMTQREVFWIIARHYEQTVLEKDAEMQEMLAEMMAEVRALPGNSGKSADEILYEMLQRELKGDQETPAQ